MLRTIEGGLPARVLPWLRGLPSPPVELSVLAAFALVALVVAQVSGLPFVAATSGSATLVGARFLTPLLVLTAWSVLAAVFAQRRGAGHVLVAVPVYAAVLWLHFNFKLWAPHLNPLRLDALYWEVDRALYPLVTACMAAIAALQRVWPSSESLYLNGFLLMFLISFCFHAVRGQGQFRRVLLAATLLQALGGIAYSLAPAMGPFLYEPGVSGQASLAQAEMMTVYRSSMAGGSAWLAVEGPNVLAAGIGAMPSLHAGFSFLFLWFAWTYARPLLVIHLPLTIYIMLAAVATRWHYLIDLPVGIALARLCIHLAYVLDRRRDSLESA